MNLDNKKCFICDNKIKPFEEFLIRSNFGTRAQHNILTYDPENGYSSIPAYNAGQNYFYVVKLDKTYSLLDIQYFMYVFNTSEEAPLIELVDSNYKVVWKKDNSNYQGMYAVETP